MNPIHQKSRQSQEINHIFALNYLVPLSNGYTPIPLKEKCPRIPTWPRIFCDSTPLALEYEQRWSLAFIPGTSQNTVFDGIGIALGGDERTLCIDVDQDDAVEEILTLVPQLRGSPACVGQKGLKAFVRYVGSRPIDSFNRNYKDANGDGLLDVLGHGRQAVIPPTVHPKTSRPYHWIDEANTLDTTSASALPVITDADLEAIDSWAVGRGASTKARTRAKAKSKPKAKKGKDEIDVNARVSAALASIEANPIRNKVEALARQFSTVHNAAAAAGGLLVIDKGGDHKPERIDIAATKHWRTCCHIIVDELGHCKEAYDLHILVSYGCAALDLPGAPAAYDHQRNAEIFNKILLAGDFEREADQDARTGASLNWWVREVTGEASGEARPKYERKKSNVKPTLKCAVKLVAAGSGKNIEIATAALSNHFRRGSAAIRAMIEIFGMINPQTGLSDAINLQAVADKVGASKNVIQRALRQAEKVGLIRRTRGNEGNKSVCVTVLPTVVDIQVARQQAQVEPQPVRQLDIVHYGDVTYPQTAETSAAMDAFCGETRLRRPLIETLLETGILPPGATDQISGVLAGIAAGRKASNGKLAGFDTLRAIAGEIGEIGLYHQNWMGSLQYALQRTAYCAALHEDKHGKELSPCAWARVFAQRLGAVNFEHGRSTYMARKDRRAYRQWGPGVVKFKSK